MRFDTNQTSKHFPASSLNPDTDLTGSYGSGVARNDQNRGWEVHDVCRLTRKHTNTIYNTITIYGMVYIYIVVFKYMPYIQMRCNTADSPRVYEVHPWHTSFPFTRASQRQAKCRRLWRRSVGSLGVFLSYKLILPDAFMATWLLASENCIPIV